MLDYFVNVEIFHQEPILPWEVQNAEHRSYVRFPYLIAVLYNDPGKIQAEEEALRAFENWIENGNENENILCDLFLDFLCILIIVNFIVIIYMFIKAMLAGKGGKGS